MTVKALVSAALVVAVLSSVATASRIPQDLAFTEGEGFSLSDIANGRLSSWFSRNHASNEGKGERRAIFATRYTVPTGIRDQFEDEWQKYEDETAKDKGNLIVDLKKTLTDNLIYISYSEWDSYEDWTDHLEEDHAKDWVEFLEEHDVNWTLYPLINKGDNQDAKKGAGKGHHGKKGELAHIAIRYFVPPSEVGGFEAQWRETAELTWDEEANHIYALRRVVTSNNEYWVYGTWDDLESYTDHFDSDHVRKLRDFANSHAITWFLTPLKKIGNEPE